MDITSQKNYEKQVAKEKAKLDKLCNEFKVKHPTTKLMNMEEQKMFDVIDKFAKKVWKQIKVLDESFVLDYVYNKCGVNI